MKEFEKEFELLLKKYGFKTYIFLTSGEDVQGSVVCGDECDLATLVEEESVNNSDFKNVLRHTAIHKIKQSLEKAEFDLEIKSGRVARG